jgi:hypothetical protein
MTSPKTPVSAAIRQGDAFVLTPSEPPGTMSVQPPIPMQTKAKAMAITPGVQG